MITGTLNRYGNCQWFGGYSFPSPVQVPSSCVSGQWHEPGVLSLYLGFAAGLRVSELVGLRLDDLELDGPYPSILVHGKARRQRRLPLWKEATRVLRAWLSVRGSAPTSEVFLNGRGEPLTDSGFRYIVKKHVQAAASSRSSLSKKRVSPHVLRHTCAVNNLQATRDIRKVALWLGHASLKSTEIYLRADPTEKLRTLEEALPADLRRGHFQVEDKLIAWLAGQKLSGDNSWHCGVNSRPPSPSSS